MINVCKSSELCVARAVSVSLCSTISQLIGCELTFSRFCAPFARSGPTHQHQQKEDEVALAEVLAESECIAATSFVSTCGAVLAILGRMVYTQPRSVEHCLVAHATISRSSAPPPPPLPACIPHLLCVDINCSIELFTCLCVPRSDEAVVTVVEAVTVVEVVGVVVAVVVARVTKKSGCLALNLDVLLRAARSSRSKSSTCTHSQSKKLKSFNISSASQSAMPRLA